MYVEIFVGYSSLEVVVDAIILQAKGALLSPQRLSPRSHANNKTITSSDPPPAMQEYSMNKHNGNDASLDTRNAHVDCSTPASRMRCS